MERYKKEIEEYNIREERRRAEERILGNVAAAHAAHAGGVMHGHHGGAMGMGMGMGGPHHNPYNPHRLTPPSIMPCSAL